MSEPIAVSIISLNEVEYIGRAIASVARLASVCYLVDGGSTDGTLDVAATVARRSGIELVAKSVEWQNDFAAQRNNCLALIDRPLSWIIRLDCDEKIPLHAKASLARILPEIPKFIICARVRQVNLIGTGNTYSAARGGWEAWPRIFRGNLPWGWTGHVHEHAMLSGRDVPDSVVADISIPIIHYGWLSQQRRREREQLYGLSAGELTDRKHIIRPVPSYYR